MKLKLFLTILILYGKNILIEAQCQTTTTPINQLSYNGTCTNSNQCSSSSNLTCTSGLCS